MKELKRAICNRYMAAAVLAAAAIMCQAYWDNGLTWNSGADVLSNITLPMALSGFSPFAAIFPALPYALRFCDEYNSGYFRFALTREKKQRYIIKKTAATALSGGIMMAAAFGIVFLTGWMISVPTVDDASGFYKMTIWYPIITVMGGKLVLLLKLGLAFLFGTVWSSVCLMISTIISNRYISYIGTFVLYQVFWLLLQKSTWNPVFLLRGDNGMYVDSLNPGVIQIIVLFFVQVVTIIFMKRKIKDA